MLILPKEKEGVVEALLGRVREDRRDWGEDL